jgi:hypothetical protein
MLRSGKFMFDPASAHFGVSHDFEEESIDAKARWFGSLSLEERMEILESWTELVLQNNPSLIGVKDAIPVEGRVRVLELPPG